jgi:hypothetical protein
MVLPGGLTPTSSACGLLEAGRHAELLMDYVLQPAADQVVDVLAGVVEVDDLGGGGK